MRRCVSLLALVLAGCGGGSDRSEVQAPPTPPPSVPPTTQGCLPALARDAIQPDTAAPTCSASDYQSYPDLPYAMNSGAQLLDLHVPRGAASALPVVVWIHGGGWRSGSKSDFAQAQRLLCRGYAVASIGYRLSGEATFPAQIHDVKAAIRYVRANAATYGLDPNRIAVFGSSAGGHLASLAGLTDGVLEDASMGNAATSSRVQAIVDWYGPTRFSEMDAQLAAQGCASGGHSGGNSPESQLLGCTVGDAACANAVQQADPTRYADRNDPPTFIMHGTRDCTVPAGQSALLDDSLQSADACSIRRAVTGAGHGGVEWMSASVQDAVEQFLDAALSSTGAATPVDVNCSAFIVNGDSRSANGATWTYSGTHQGVAYSLEGVLFTPAGSGPFPAVVISHGFGGSPANYSATIARTMTGWGMAAIATMYTHAAPPQDEGNLPAGDYGASTANVLRAHKARDLLSCLGVVDMRRVAAHGHSMGAFVTGELLGTYPFDFRAASHTAGGVSSGPNATREATARQIRTPYQLHHGDQDTTVALSQDRTLDAILTEVGAPHELIVYPGYTHSQIANDATMLGRVREWYRTHGVL